MQPLDDERLAVPDALRFTARDPLHPLQCSATLCTAAQGASRAVRSMEACLAQVCVYATPNDVALPMILRYELAVHRQVTPPPQRRVVERCRWRCLQQLQQHTQRITSQPLAWASALQADMNIDEQREHAA